MKYKKTAIIFGVTGQDGAYLSHFLLQKGYKVIGVTRNKSQKNLFFVNMKKMRPMPKISINYIFLISYLYGIKHFL